MSRSLLFLAMAGVALVALPATASAQTAAYEGFGYASGATLNGQSGGTGFWTGAWNATQPTDFTIQTGSLTPPAQSAALITTGNSVGLGSSTLFTAATRPIPNLATFNGGQVWASFLISLTGAGLFNTF